MEGLETCPKCGRPIAADALWCELCGPVADVQTEGPFANTGPRHRRASVHGHSLPIAGKGGSWFRKRWRSASSALRVALGALFAFAAFVYALYGPLAFDVCYWALGKVARLRSGRRLRVGVSVGFAAMYLVAIGLSGSTQRQQTAPGAASTPLVAAAAAHQSASAALATLAPATALRSASVAASASPHASSPDADDESSSSAGASFVAGATGVVPPSAGTAQRLPGEPDPTLTPGALNPSVTQATIHSTICVSGWTDTIRPPESFTNALKVEQIGQYGYADTRASSYEEDHLISLELGGAPADARNLWPEPYTASLADGRPTGAHTKDAFETKLKTEVCAGTITLAQGQADIGDHWVHACYDIALTSSPTNPAGTTVPTAHVTAPPTTHATAPPATPVVTAPPIASLSVSITSLPASVGPNANATLVATTSPGATCSVSVTYASGTVSTAAGLQTHPVADSSGTVSWTWKVGARTGAGTSTAYVKCTLNGDSASASQTFEVT